jgi:serine/threonine-protein kinase
MARTKDDARLAGRYELGEVIGRGGMGEVRAGTDRRLGRPIAVKLLRADLADDPEIRARFEGEARAAARLAHPNVVAVFDTGEVDGQPFIVMERLPGDTLADAIAREPLSPDAARRMAGQMLGALQVAHDAGIVHRDVKPGNLLRADDGSWKVADFGIAKSTEAAVDLTLTGKLIGTPAYLAPERIAGRAATPASDIYSAGVVLAEALTGAHPDDDDAEPRRDLDPALAAVVSRAMAQDPAQRFASADEMREALTTTGPATVPSTPVPSGSSPTATATRVLPHRSRPRTRLHPGWIAAALAALVVVVALVFAMQQDGDGDAPMPAQDTAPSTVAVDEPGAGAPLPESLDDALERLAESVQP